MGGCLFLNNKYIYFFLFSYSQKIIKNSDLSLNPTADVNENKISINNESKVNIIKNSYNNNQLQSINNNNNILKDGILETDNKISQIIMNINSNFKSANFQYVQSQKHIGSNQNNNKELNNNENRYKNKNNDIFLPLIHFTNLSSKKLKLLGSSSKTKTDNDKNET